LRELIVTVVLPRDSRGEELFCGGQFGLELRTIAAVRSPGEIDREGQQNGSNNFSETKPVRPLCAPAPEVAKEGSRVLVTWRGVIWTHTTAA
jgi:hypothetical protein